MQESRNDLLGEQLDLLWRVMSNNGQGLAAVRLFRSALQTLSDATDSDMRPILHAMAKAEQSLTEAHDDVVRLLKLVGHGQPEHTRQQARQAAILRKIAKEGRGIVAFAEGASDNGGVEFVLDVSNTHPPPPPKPKTGK